MLPAYVAVCRRSCTEIPKFVYQGYIYYVITVRRQVMLRGKHNIRSTSAALVATIYWLRFVFLVKINADPFWKCSYLRWHFKLLVDYLVDIKPFVFTYVIFDFCRIFQVQKYYSITYHNVYLCLVIISILDAHSIY